MLPGQPNQCREFPRTPLAETDAWSSREACERLKISPRWQYCVRASTTGYARIAVCTSSETLEELAFPVPVELTTKLVWDVGDVVERPVGEPADCVLLEVMLAVYFNIW